MTFDRTRATPCLFRTTPASWGVARVVRLGAVLLASFSFVLAGTASSQEASRASGGEHPALVLGHVAELDSAILGERRRLLVHLPNGYANSGWRRYPVLVLLDGASNLKHVVGNLHALAEGGMVPRTIVVGVENTDRWRDLTPRRVEGMVTSGGGASFLSFLTKELLPWIDARYRTTGYRVLEGHSLGGLTALEALRAQPDTFDAVIALSPSLEVDGGASYAAFREFLDARERLDARLYLALADERVERPWFDRLELELGKRAPVGLAWQAQRFPDDDHASVRVTGGLAGLRFVFRDWRLASKDIVTLGLEEAEAFLEHAAKVYKEPRALGMMALTDAGYYALDDEATRARGFELFQEAVERWPDDPYPYACMGEGHERSGREAEALTWMERALERLANDRFDDPAYYEAMAARVRAKLERRE